MGHLTNVIDAMFNPDHIAVVGASARRSTAGGNMVVRNLKELSFSGRISIVNPSGGKIEGIQAVTSIQELEVPDVAVVSLPAPAVVGALRELEAVGCPTAVVPTSGLDAEQLAELRAFTAESKIFVHGPNCMGFINAVAKKPLWIEEGVLLDVPPGRTALIAQSGSAAIFVARTASPLGFSKIISTGNEVAATTATYIDYLADDPDTDQIGVVIESIPDVAAFKRAVAKARNVDKPVVVLKVGRTEAGGAATTAHTGAMISPDAAYSALFKSLDLPVVADYDELASTLECLAVLGKRRPAPRGIGVATISGGQAALAADLAEAVGASVPALSAQTRTVLRGILPDVTPNNPLDAGGSVVAPQGSYAQAVAELASDASLGSIMLVLDAQQTLSDIDISYEDDFFIAAAELAAKSDKPVVVASSSSVSLHARAVKLAGHDVPVIRGIRNGLVALNAAAANHNAIEEPQRPPGLPGPSEVQRLRTSLASTSGPLDAHLSKTILEAYGVPLVRSTQVGSGDEAIAWAEANGYPVVLKVSSPDVPHRSDAGGVITDLQDAEAVSNASAAITASVHKHVPGARISGFEIQQFVGKSVEAFTGYVTDPLLGPTIGLGLGGTLVELLGDVVEGLTPLDTERAHEMLADTRLAQILAGYRNLLPATTPDGLIDAVVRLSWLADDLGDLITEVDLNPVLIEHGSGRVCIVDSLLVCGTENRHVQ